MKSQILSLKATSYEINGADAQSFISLGTSYNNPDNNNNNNSNNNSKNISKYLGNSNAYATNLVNLNPNSSFSRWFHSQ